MSIVAIQNGIYRIQNGKSSSSVLMTEPSLALAPAHVFGHVWTGEDNQKWLIEDAGDSGYTIKNVATQRFLSIPAKADHGVKVCGTGIATHWVFRAFGSAPTLYRLFVKGYDLNIDLDNYGDSTPGTGITLWGWEQRTDTPQQTWCLDRLDNKKPSSLPAGNQPSLASSQMPHSHAYVANGVYTIRNAKASDRILMMDISLAQAHTHVYTHIWTGADNQKWFFEDTKNGGYTIKNVGTDKYLSVSSETDEVTKGGAWVHGTFIPTQWTLGSTAIVPFAHRIFLKGTDMNVDLNNWGDSMLGNGVALWGWENDSNRPERCWFIERLDEDSNVYNQESTLAPESEPKLADEWAQQRRFSSDSASRIPAQALGLDSEGATRSVFTTTATTMTEDDECIVTTRTTETKTTVITRRTKRASSVA